MTGVDVEELDEVEASITAISNGTSGRPLPVPPHDDDQYPPDEPPIPAQQVEASAAQSLEARIDAEVQRLRIRVAARERVAAELAAANPASPFDAGTLREILSRPAEPTARVESIIPWEAGTLVVAQRKTGKTTWELNLARALLSGEDFLGRLGVKRIDGNVALLNFEVSAATIARWADEHHIDRDRLFLVNLRGRVNPLNNPQQRAKLATLLRQHDVESLLVDPFGRAYTGQSQNDPGEVGAWLTELDRFTRTEVGALDLVLTTHAGWDGERTRGSSALEDWADSIVTLVRDRDDDKQRFLRATGRDIDIDEDRLIYEPTNRTLTLSGTGSRATLAQDRKSDGLAAAAEPIILATPDGMNISEVEKILRDAGHRFRSGDVSRVLAQLAGAGRIDLLRIAGRSKIYGRHPNIPDSPNVLPESSMHSPNPPIRGGDNAGTTNNTSHPASQGPCTHCGQSTARYGDDGKPSCLACQAATT